MPKPLSQKRKLYYNQKFLGHISNPSERLEFIVKTLYPDHCWHVGKNHMGLMVGYSCMEAPGPKISGEDVFRRLSKEFGVRNQRMKYTRGLARKALAQVVFPNPEDCRDVFFI